ncbi:MAG: hypothetical protein JJE22_02560, partial [Bacteroidia bacterium]|nr:hypothetical protein [Bacteroidia bacterium]
ITKEILEQSKYCGTGKDDHSIGNNCAIAFALVDIFPNVYVTNDYIFPLGTGFEKGQEIKIPMPVIARQFVKLFDGFCHTPNLRLLLPEFDFVIDIPDEAIEQINIDEVRELVEGSKKIVELFS